MNQEALVTVWQRQQGDAEADAEFQKPSLPSRIVKPEVEESGGSGGVGLGDIGLKRRPCRVIQLGVGMQEQQPWRASRLGPTSQLLPRPGSEDRMQAPCAAARDRIVRRAAVHDDNFMRRR